MDAPETASRSLPPFHLAFPVTDLGATRAFYVELLGCRLGREDERWIDFDFFGHQITAHLVDGLDRAGASNMVDGKGVPIPHFGAVLAWDHWHALAERLQQANVTFRIAPHIRFPGQVGEQATMFFDDPSGNHLELKSLQDPGQLFQR
jgi:hypothetical protein